MVTFSNNSGNKQEMTHIKLYTTYGTVDTSQSPVFFCSPMGLHAWQAQPFLQFQLSAASCMDNTYCSEYHKIFQTNQNRTYPNNTSQVKMK